MYDNKILKRIHVDNHVCEYDISKNRIYQKTQKIFVENMNVEHMCLYIITAGT